MDMGTVQVLGPLTLKCSIFTAIFSNNDLIIGISAIFVFGVFTYTYYKYINVGVYNKFKLGLLRLSFIGAAIVDTAKETVVYVTDAELNEILQIVFSEIGTSREIGVALLQSLGLYTSTVVQYLIYLGYIIIP
jgi:hypothetical protein